MEPLHCPICKSTFSRKEHLRRHISIRKFDSIDSDRPLFVEVIVVMRADEYKIITAVSLCAKDVAKVLIEGNGHSALLDIRRHHHENTGLICLPVIRDILRRHVDVCTLSNNDTALSKHVLRKSPGLVSGPERPQELEESLPNVANLSPPPSLDHLICQMETDSYQESIRCGASRSLAIFIRIISTFDITGIFDPDFTLPGSFSSRETSLYHSQESRTSTWGLPSSVTLMDFSGATGVSVSPRSSACGDEAPPVAYQTYDLNCESPQFAMPQPTETSMESGEPWILPCEPSPSPEPDDCLWVSNEIITRLRDGISQQSLSQSPYPREWSSWLQNDCFALFGPNSLRKFTEEYWSTWHIHWPVIHKTTFRIPTASAALVAAMVLLGASYSPHATTRERARYWADSVEAMVFADEYFGSATVFSALNAACMERRLRALQAGHAMCIYQTFEGNTMARRRARRSRFNEVVAVSSPDP